MHVIMQQLQKARAVKSLNNLVCKETDLSFARFVEFIYMLIASLHFIPEIFSNLDKIGRKLKNDLAFKNSL